MASSFLRRIASATPVADWVTCALTSSAWASSRPTFISAAAARIWARIAQITAPAATAIAPKASIRNAFMLCS